jgi:hypothetical protein
MEVPQGNKQKKKQNCHFFLNNIREYKWRTGPAWGWERELCTNRRGRRWGKGVGGLI